ncbi:hypothetical protein [Algibacter pectinivorans]|uniref:Uncharacterized protein n=1 Tax=Algibacter pectinivorans TaxID=870482 RepID=A0A1I1S4M8_9FLAO|nr:hypothetical protein [Algibacter pectinivorans]SFD41485.1 hypothetical protein SAMN04487987_11313 [Algibacter pectinivorans]
MIRKNKNLKKKTIIFINVFFALFFLISCEKDGDVFLRVENLRTYEIVNLKIGSLDYGNIRPNETTDYQQIDTGTFNSSYEMNGRELAGEIKTWGMGNLKLQIQNNGELKFIDE